MLSGFLITSLNEAERILSSDEHTAFDNLISIGSREDPMPVGYQKIGHRLRLVFDDVWTKSTVAAGYEPAHPADISLLVDFCARLRGRTLIHCWAGISRSSAAAIVLAAIQTGPGQEAAAVATVLLAKPNVNPNKWIVKLADRNLKRGGRLLRAVCERFPGSPDQLLD